MHLDYPSVPYCGPLNSQLHPGAVILCKGQSFPGTDFFAISLQCGPSTSFTDDVALYLSAAFSPPPRIIRNSLISQQWGPEESFGGFPIHPGPFEIMIMVDHGEFRIAVNGQHFTEYRHRIPFENISHVHLTGAMRIDSFSVWYSGQNQTMSSGASYPSGPGLYPKIPSDLASPPSAPGFNLDGPSPTYVVPYPPPDHIPYPTDVPALPSHPIGPPPVYGAGGPTPAYPSPYGPTPPPPPYSQGQPAGTYVYPPPDGYPNKESGGNKSGGGIGNMISGALTGVAGGIAANAIGNRLLGRHHCGPSSMIPGIVSGVAGSVLSGGHKQKHKHKRSSAAIPIAGIAAGAGAAALGAALLSGANPMKKVFKHKHSYGFHGHSSSSSSSEEE